MGNSLLCSRMGTTWLSFSHNYWAWDDVNQHFCDSSYIFVTMYEYKVCWMALVEYHVTISFQSLLSGSHFGSLCHKIKQLPWTLTNGPGLLFISSLTVYTSYRGVLWVDDMKWQHMRKCVAHVHNWSMFSFGNTVNLFTLYTVKRAGCSCWYDNL